MHPFATTKNLVLSAIVAAASIVIPATANAETAPQTAASLNAGASVIGSRQSLIAPAKLNCGVQWTATIPAKSSQLWFTYDWNPKNFVSWSIMDVTVPDGGPALDLTKVGTERNTPNTVTYWLSVANTSSHSKYFEGRFCYEK